MTSNAAAHKPHEDDFDPGLVACATESEADVRADGGPDPKGVGKRYFLKWEEIKVDESCECAPRYSSDV